MAKRSKAWCFTLNNYTNEEYMQATTEEEWLKFAIIGKERGENGTPHLQGYYYGHNNLSMKKLKQKLSRAHFEIAKGTPQENIAYCSKEDNNPYRWGSEPLTQDQRGELGKRSWEEAKKMAIEGKIDDIPGSIYVCQYNNLKRIAADHQQQPSGLENTAGVWIFGLSGSGKSRMVWQKYPTAYRKMMNKWWDNYNKEEIVVLEDVDKENGKWLGFYLKIWADHYPFRAEVKNSSMMIRPKLFIVTSQYQIHEIWQDEETRDAITRRFRIINRNENEEI